MIERTRFAVNRITCPSLGLEDFFRFTRDLGLTKVEIRNDLPGGAAVDGMPPASAAELARKYGISIISINALQKFNLKAVEAKNVAELDKVLELAAALHCKAIVLCPNNDKNDHRDARSKVEETVSALKAYGPLFKKRGILGFVEPLGFPESSLSSIVVASETIKKSGFDCYRMVYDTFHFFLGPDNENDIDAPIVSRGGPHPRLGRRGVHPEGDLARRAAHPRLRGGQDGKQGPDRPDRGPGLRGRHLLRAVLPGRAADEPRGAGVGAGQEHRVT